LVHLAHGVFSLDVFLEQSNWFTKKPQMKPVEIDGLAPFLGSRRPFWQIQIFPWEVVKHRKNTRLPPEDSRIHAKAVY
jgi:hypothetical protein